MATKKPASKKAAPAKKAPAKPAPKKAASKPAPKKATPAKKAAAKPAPKKATPKPAPKKAAPAKKVAAKPAPKKPAAKPAPIAKKAAPAKKAPVVKAAPAKVAARPVAKPAAKPVPAPVVKPAPKPFQPPVLKKPEVKAPPAPPVKPVRKPLEPIKDIKVPKTSVKTSVPYHPGYTPLEKRADTAKNTDPLVRYSDADLNEFKELINRKLEAAKKELTYLQGLITRKDEMGGDNDDARYMTMEDGSMSMEREQLSQMASRQITYIDHLEKALMRIENKTYGICRVTGRLIDKARLRAVPHATLSLEAKLGLVKPTAE
ncbi:transcriptional regulator, TraR/DksA family [Hydrobacter penzbergensis]|jgi:RNA polymerase-binding transcription factor DksA|uniref:Transcriptional regulator, TraR/DksA family n=1 Tax=Hydrobacter penzbergensis TaxID=1235997 RepID=A0A8X8IF85_9BACT|nr:TraR/DksA C4-type zinc finger protein [Hydrobacter penzbergensis]PQV60643.1 RNA polymerase-binding transcription factor DksA [Sediminibacterium magnilacihabitans]SDW36759.1 transcriptional regulator, TraR/DksA family [Hydrobacter penzbergensis]